MFDIARFQIIGRVGAIRPFDKVTRISVATNASYKGGNGAWVDRIFWNEVVVFERVAERDLSGWWELWSVINATARELPPPGKASLN